jgi:purine-binding chemotaxis protein CheW
VVRDASVYLKGVINLRGKIIPVIDMRAKFGIAEKPYDDRTVFVIVDVSGARDVFNFGMAVDAVHDVANIADAEIENAADVGLKLKNAYLLGIAKSERGMLMVLNIDRVLTTDEIVDLGLAEQAVKA